MKFCYQVATPDVKIAPSVTAFQGPLDNSFAQLAKLGYDGVELMTLDPDRLDWNEVRFDAEKNGLSIVLVCTGEICGQLGLTYTDRDAERRKEAVARTMRIIDFAHAVGAGIVNIGRIRGQYLPDVDRACTDAWAVEALRKVSDYAAEKSIVIALETVTKLQTNYINTLEEAVEMIRMVDRPNFKLMMDIFHLNIEEKSIVEAIRTYSPWNVHVHLADNNRSYPGQCGLDFTQIIRTFRECGYDGAFCTEIYQLPNQEEAAAGAIAHLAPIFADVYGRERR